ncbi:MAG: response regulator [Magnetococcales bacterium]|nr:response regulator [Magnetococcales bacterium]
MPTAQWVAGLVILAITLLGFVVGVWSWHVLSRVETGLPEEPMRRQRFLSGVIQALSRLERAIHAVGANATLLHRNELLLSSDYLFDALTRSKVDGCSTEVESALRAARSALSWIDNPHTFASDPASQQLVREQLTYARHQLTQTYVTIQEGTIRDLHASREQLRALRNSLVSAVVVLAIFTPALAGVILLQRRTQKQLRIAKQEADAANRAKSQFLATMSHEIRTPLNGVLGMTQLLKKTGLSSTQSRYLQAMTQAGEHLFYTLNDILDLAKIEAGRMVLDPVDFSWRELLDGLRTLFVPQAEIKGIRFDCAWDPELPECLHGDVVRIRQVLFNLVGNAIKFTATGEVQLRLQHESCAPGSCLIRITVSDTGIGIHPDRLPKLFEPFVQEDSTTTRLYGGSGLGLTISRQLVLLMGGRIEVQSRHGHGSVFTVLLPLGIGQELVPDEALHTIRKLAVLVVEDDPINREVIRHWLESEGHRVTQVSAGPEAIEELSWERFDVVLMDLRMPGMDGVEVTRRIRIGQEPWNDIPVLIVTADVVSDELLRCQKAGVNAVLTKPVRFSRLRSLLAGVAQGLTIADYPQPGGNLEDGSADPGTLLDEALLQSLISGMGKVRWEELVERLLQQGEGLCAQLRQSGPHLEREQARALIHRFKGGAAFLGLSGCVAWSVRVGEMMRTDEDIRALSGLTGLLDDYPELVSQTRMAFQAWPITE